MIYFSELQRKKVITEDQVHVGTLEDIIFLASENPSITKIIVRGPLEERLIIPIEYVQKFNQTIVLSKNYIVSSLEENELYLVKNLLDKQIIDLKGYKIVRVNDVAIQDKGRLYIAGVDIGFLGILRSLRLEKPIVIFLTRFGIKLRSQFLSWGDIQPLELVHGAVKLRKQEEKLKKIQPEDLADYLERTNIGNAERILKILDEKKAAAVIESLNLNYRAAIFKNYKPEKAAHLLSYIDPDDAVDILLTLPSKRREQVLDRVTENQRKIYNHLIHYSTTPIGNILTTEYLTVKPEELVKEVIRKLQSETSEFASLHAVYVINEKKELFGVFDLHELLQQDLETPIYKFMTQNVVVLHLTTPAEIALKRMEKYRLSALPVIDNTHNILGIVTLTDLIELFLNKII